MLTDLQIDVEFFLCCFVRHPRNEWYTGKTDEAHKNSASVLYFPCILIVLPLISVKYYPVSTVWLEGNQNRQDFLLWVTGPKHPLSEGLPEDLLVTEECSISQHTLCLPVSETCLSVTLENLHPQFLLTLLNMLVFQVQHPKCGYKINDYRFLS